MKIIAAFEVPDGTSPDDVQVLADWLNDNLRTPGRRELWPDAHVWEAPDFAQALALYLPLPGNDVQDALTDLLAEVSEA